MQRAHVSLSAVDVHQFDEGGFSRSPCYRLPQNRSFLLGNVRGEGGIVVAQDNFVSHGISLPFGRIRHHAPTIRLSRLR